jgi:hypothetical protein
MRSGWEESKNQKLKVRVWPVYPGTPISRLAFPGMRNDWMRFIPQRVPAPSGTLTGVSQL